MCNPITLLLLLMSRIPLHYVAISNADAFPRNLFGRSVTPNILILISGGYTCNHEYRLGLQQYVAPIRVLVFRTAAATRVLVFEWDR